MGQNPADRIRAAEIFKCCSEEVWDRYLTKV